MKRKHIFHSFLALLSLIADKEIRAQHTISGTVTNTAKEPLPAASVTIKENNSGTHTNEKGFFSLATELTGTVTLHISCIGYITKDEIIHADSATGITITLDHQPKDLGEVVITSAGSFEASDKAKGASLTPIDAMTVAGSGGDIANSLRALPGTQQVGEKEGLFVRGGTGEEAKQFMDGILIKNPNFTSIPGIPQYARINPFLFKGILFSSGGYSALYGQAMSSALILESIDLPDQSSASFHLFPMMTGIGFQNLSRSQKSSYGINARYGNSWFFNRITHATPDFFHDPEYIMADANFRVRTSKTGMLKFYTNYGYSHAGLRNPDTDSIGLLSSYQVKGINLYSNLSYREKLGQRWKIDAALAHNYYKDDRQTRLLDGGKNVLALPQAPFNQKNNDIRLRSDFAQARAVLTRSFARYQALRIGAEYFYSRDCFTRNDTATGVQDNLIAAFAEGDIYIAKGIAAKLGLRVEYSSALRRTALAPRASLAYRFADGGQLNVAYGIFYQKPEADYPAATGQLNYSRAEHYILNYQKKLSNRLLRIEAYYKKYHKLITTAPAISNNGTGYARGVELFFRDKKTFRNFDYWFTYTYLDTKRQYLDYPYALRPNFTTPHTASFVIKRFFQDINLNANLAYTFATGRPYYRIQQTQNSKTAIADQGITNTYSGLNLSFAYLFTLFKKWKNKDFSGIGFGMNNVLGRQQVFDYRYSYNGLLKTPVMLAAPRTFYFGIFMSFGIDRRDDFMNDNL